MEDLKIIGSHQTESKHFNSIDEFNIYYVKHKAEMTDMTTQKLNKLFIIDGYRITKKGTRDADGKRVSGEICLKPTHVEHSCAGNRINSTKLMNDNDDTKQFDSFASRIDQLEAKIKLLTDTVNKIIDHLN